ncbi:hypothetical protein [Acinetobacter ursingii]|uniref:hypothetical protein n=1 Tax=Acinetobacter ursingii TaxID=108980 RepID=UPI0021CDB03E|nr:hypothetical protein [Acinetobacter ursingii]
MKIELIEQFKAAFTDSLVYADLATEYTSYEIFEINNGKFELDAVQQAYEEWSQHISVKTKRTEFNKNLNHLVDGQHAVIPNELTWEQLQTLSDDPEFFEYWQAACSGDSGEDCACLAIQAIHKALPNIEYGSHANG